VVDYLSKNLPFPIAGFTTIGAATNANSDPLSLSLTLFIGDDISGDIYTTNELDQNNYEDEVKKIHDLASEKGAPKFIFTFMPLTNNVTGNDIFDVLTSLSDTPLFGTTCCDQSSEHSKAFVLRNGEHYNNRATFIYVYGNITVDFKIVSIRQQDVQQYRGLITKAHGSVLEEINGISAMSYFEKLGMSSQQIRSGLGATPLYIENSTDNGIGICRDIFSVDELGGLHCAGNIPQGASVSLGRINYEIVTSTTKRIVDKLQDPDIKGLYLLSCMSRFITLGLLGQDEIDLVIKNCQQFPLSLAYSGGEICPIIDQNGKLINRYHNNTFIALIVK
jgi:hypothetical protein